MLDAQMFNPKAAENNAQVMARANRLSAEIRPERPPAEQTQALNWFTIEKKDGELQLKATANTTQVDVSSLNLFRDEAAAPKNLNFFGHKIDLKAKIDNFKENYIKNFSLSKSHNLMVARFAEVKCGFYSYLLGLLGVSSEDIRKLQKKAIEGSISQNKLLFEENEYNSELLGIVGGGGKKQTRAQQRVASEIRSQLSLQMKNLGLGDFYSQRKILEIQIEQCRKIAAKFQEEKSTLEYQLAMFGEN